MTTVNFDYHHSYPVGRHRGRVDLPQLAHGTARGPKCGCGLEMAYNGQRGWYCLRCG